MQGQCELDPPLILPAQQGRGEETPVNSISRRPPRICSGLCVLRARLPLDGSHQLAIHAFRQHNVQRTRDGGYILRHLGLRTELQPAAEHVQTRRRPPPQFPRIVHLPPLHTAIRQHGGRPTRGVRHAPPEAVRRHVESRDLYGLVFRPAGRRPPRHLVQQQSFWKHTRPRYRHISEVPPADMDHPRRVPWERDAVCVLHGVLQGFTTHTHGIHLAGHLRRLRLADSLRIEFHVWAVHC